MSEGGPSKDSCAVRPSQDRNRNIIHPGSVRVDDALGVTTLYGSLPLQTRDDCSDGDNNISSLSSEGLRKYISNLFPPLRQRPLLLTAMFALPFFAAVAWLSEFIQQQPITITPKSSSSSPSLRHEFIAMYGRVNADNLSNDANLKSSKNNRYIWKGDGNKNKQWCHANRCQCTTCNGKWCAIDAPPSFITAVPSRTTEEVGSASAGYCILENDGTGTSSSCEAGGREAEGSVSLSSDITFADLAAFMLPTYFQGCIDLCASTIIPAVIDDTTTSTSVMPGEVAILRKTILKTRDLIDVFSPVYPTHTLTWKEWSLSYFRRHFDRGYYILMGSSSHDPEIQQVKEGAEEDLWRTLRKILADGYRLIGEFQDLDHAHIVYTPSQLAEYQQEVWAWLVEFRNFAETSRQNIFSYLSLPCEEQGRKSRRSHCQYAHGHVSHLFWATTSLHNLPIGKDKAKDALAKLGNAQLKRAETYLLDALSYQYVLNSTQAEISTFSPLHHHNHHRGHRFRHHRRLQQGHDDAEEDESAEGNGGIVNVQEKYHNARKEIRSFLDELVLFGDLLLPSSSVTPEILRGEISTTPLPAIACISGYSAVKILTDQAVNALETTRQMLGDLNDDYAAYEWYKEWNMNPEEQLTLQTAIETRWKRFREWQHEVDLLAKMEFLRNVMMHPDQTWTFNPSASPSPGPSTSSPSSSEPTTIRPSPYIQPTTASSSSREPTIGQTMSPATPEPTTTHPTSRDQTTSASIEPTTANPSSADPTLSPMKIPDTREPTTVRPSSRQQSTPPFIEPTTPSPSSGASTISPMEVPATPEPTTISPSSIQHTKPLLIEPTTASPSSTDPTLAPRGQPMKSPDTPDSTITSPSRIQQTKPPFIEPAAGNPSSAEPTLGSLKNPATPEGSAVSPTRSQQTTAPFIERLWSTLSSGEPIIGPMTRPATAKAEKGSQ